MSKYHATKVKANGMTFDSKKEYARWCELKLLSRAGKISDLRRQVRYLLIPAQYDDDGMKIYGAITYVADFVYVEDGNTIVEDAKGYLTDVYKIKRALMLYFHGIRIKEV